uniref:RING-type E3 ubiquitin transferase n=1 Tax=Kalanchoe fedtschenkoi TaxID=63787 RepID=A0A7N0RBR2_KALFE
MQVHHSVCAELMKLVGQISLILPKIEAARPGCSSGLQALCQLSRANEKSKLLLQSCCDSSKLYLAISGDVLVSRCERWRNLMDRSLTQIQTMVPVLLSAEISRIIDVVRSATFTLGSCEEEAGNVLRELIYHYASLPDLRVKSEIEALQIAASRLHINSSKALLIERRSIKKLLAEVTDNDLKKRELLEYLYAILRKYGKSMVGETAGMVSPRLKASNASKTSQVSSQSYEPIRTEHQIPCWEDEIQKSKKTVGIPPEELTCPISLRIMFDPVVIASGQTFERMWIEKWFAEGHLTCPKTNMNLSHLSWTPNVAIKDLISKWCREHGITLTDPSIASDKDVCSASFVSLASSFRSLRLPKDISSASMDSLGSFCSESELSHVKVSKLRSCIPSCTNADSPRPNFRGTPIETIQDNLSKLPFHLWESQLQILEEAEKNLKSTDGSSTAISFACYIETVSRFLKHAHELHDLQAQKAGSQLLLTFVREKRNEIPALPMGVFDVLIVLLNSNSIGEVLDIIEVLSSYKHCRSKLVASGALSSFVNILDSSREEYYDPTLKILYNVCLDDENHSDLISLEPIPRINRFLRNNSLRRFVLVIMRTLCHLEKARISISETEGCITYIVELLDLGSPEDQENAAFILLALCSQHTHCCQTVMNEGVIPALVNISVNGNNKGKTYATELLRLLRDIDFVEEHDHQEESDIHDNHQPISYSNEAPASKAADPTSMISNPTTKGSGFFGRRLKFSKYSFLAPKKKH